MLCRTLQSRGKSFTPESNVLMEESRSWREDWREETDEARATGAVMATKIEIISNIRGFIGASLDLTPLLLFTAAAEGLA